MATYYGDQFAALATDVTSADSARRAAGPLSHPGKEVAVSIGRVQVDGTANGDVLRVIRSVPSSARIWELWATIDPPSGGNISAGNVDIGVYLAGLNHDGAAVSDNVFESAQSVTSGLVRADAFKGASLTDLDRGKPLWELLGLSEDPVTLYDICATTDTGWAFSSGTEIFQLEAVFLVD